MGRYIQNCSSAFSWAQRVGPSVSKGSDAYTNWSAPEYASDYRKTLDRWATPLSFTVFHELCHLLLNMDDYVLSRPFEWLGGTINKAYRFKGAVQLAQEQPDAIIDSVDNFTMSVFALFISENGWSTGIATKAGPVPSAAPRAPAGGGDGSDDSFQIQ
ncbi:hypothetical protein ABVK25_003755 [Lepraria finkii]|uniref:Uncharacterized protein n=1 Tax=Lepraria finkii TaxID=1340010 RepID=A0ABR4BE29_9LECA